MRIKTVVYMVVISLIMTNFYPYLQSDPKVHLYVLTAGNTKQEKLFLERIKEKTGCLCQCNDPCQYNPCRCCFGDRCDFECCGCFPGINNVTGIGTERIRDQFAPDDNKKTLKFINLKSHRFYSVGEPLRTVSNIAKKLSTEIAKDIDGIHIILDCGCSWHGINSYNLFCQMIDEDKEIITWSNGKMKKSDFKLPPYNWVERNCNYRKKMSHPIIHVKITIPGSYAASNPRGKFFNSSFDKNKLEKKETVGHRNFNVEKRHWKYGKTPLKWFTVSTTSRTLNAAEDAIDYVLELKEVKEMLEKEDFDYYDSREKKEMSDEEELENL